MTNKIRKALGLVAATALLALMPSLARAQSPVPFIPADSNGISAAVSAVSTDVAFYVKYIGTATSGNASTVAVAGNNSMAFVANGVADATINPNSGAGACGNTAGTLDLTQANCSTIGPLLDMINGSPNWLAWPAGALRTDASNAKLNNFTAASAETGKAVTWVTTGQLAITLDVRPANMFATDGENMAFGVQGNRLNPNPFGGMQTLVVGEIENVTSTGVVGQLVTYGVTQRFLRKQTKPSGAAAAPISYSEAVRTIWSQAGAATTVQGTCYIPLLSSYGERILVRISATVSLTAPQMVASGFFWKSTVP